MKHIFALGALVFVGAIGWQIGERLSSDAIALSLGVLFGVFAGLPVALLVLASDRRREPAPPPQQPPPAPTIGGGELRRLPLPPNFKPPRHERAQWVVVDGDDPPRIVG